MFQRKKGSTRPRQATIKDVAIAAGVSITTVSNFLNGRTGSMTEETWQRVEEAMNALDYSPSSIARGLVTRQTATLGLIISEIETPLFLQAVTSIEPIGRAAGYNLLLCNARNTEDERQVLSLLLEKRVEGIMFLSTSEHLEHGHLVELQSSGMPLALVNRALKHDGIYQIHWDNIRGVANAVRHLSELGHRRIAHLRGPSDRRSSQERLQGYRLGLEQMGLHYREDYVGDGDFTASHKLWTREALRLLSLSPRPTAVIGSDDTVAAVVMRTVQNEGLRVPQDMSVVGVDDQPFCAYLNPALTTVRLPVMEAGQLAAKVLIDWVSDGQTTPQSTVLPCELIARESSGPAP